VPFVPYDWKRLWHTAIYANRWRLCADDAVVFRLFLRIAKTGRC